VTFKDLQKVIHSQSQSNTEHSQQQLRLQQLNRLRNKTFWNWDKNAHKEKNRVTKGECCLNHIMGLLAADLRWLEMLEITGPLSLLCEILYLHA
jgi:hypothetical protein